MNIGVITAMSNEYEQIINLLGNATMIRHEHLNYVEGSLGIHTILVMKCGIGKVNAALGASDMIHTYHPDCIISTGVAGGLGKSIHVMDVVAAQQVVYHDVWCGGGNKYGQVQDFPLYYECDETLYHTAMSMKKNSFVKGGLICSGDTFIETKEETDKIAAHFPEALAADMESTAIAQTCHIYNIPFISFRIVSDTPEQEENNYTQYDNFWAKMANKSFDVTKDFLFSLPANLKNKIKENG